MSCFFFTALLANCPCQAARVVSTSETKALAHVQENRLYMSQCFLMRFVQTCLNTISGLGIYGFLSYH